MTFADAAESALRKQFLDGRVTQLEYARRVGRVRRLVILRNAAGLAAIAGALALILSPFL